jgi:hypothetical protein
VSTEVPELGVWLTPLDRPWSTCVGFLRGRVFVTQGLAKLLDAEELAAVIAHEQAHALRRDNLRQLLAQAAFGPTVIMPTAHAFLRRLQASVERAADLEAIRRDTTEPALASALVKAARKLRDLSGDPDEEPLRRRLANRARSSCSTPPSRPTRPSRCVAASRCSRRPRCSSSSSPSSLPSAHPPSARSSRACWRR